MPGYRTLVNMTNDIVIGIIQLSQAPCLACLSKARRSPARSRQKIGANDAHGKRQCYDNRPRRCCRCLPRCPLDSTPHPGADRARPSCRRDNSARRPPQSDSRIGKRRHQRRNACGLASDTWRREPESNRRTRLCRPLHNHSAIAPLPPSRRRKQKGESSAFPSDSGAGDESRTRDLNLGKVALYQLSYSRRTDAHYNRRRHQVNGFWPRSQATPGTSSRPSKAKSGKRLCRSARCQSTADRAGRGDRGRAASESRSFAKSS